VFHAVTLGMIDTFQSGATEGWFAGGSPLGGERAASYADSRLTWLDDR
jgi:hypothetical protein